MNNEQFCRDYRAGLDPDLEPIERILRSNPAAVIAREFELTGPCQTVVNACASGTDAVGLAASWIRGGICDLAIAGGADELGRITYNGFISLMISDDSPCKPFDRNRKGLNLGEGAAMLVLESEEVRKKRGSHARSYLLGYGSACDAHHLTAPKPDGEGLRAAIAEALSCCGTPAESVSFVNAHGTGTPDNDRVESRVLADLLPGVPFISTKGYTGHTLGAAGAIEAVFTIACLERGMIPGSAGFTTADPELGGTPADRMYQGYGSGCAFGVTCLWRQQLGHTVGHKGYSVMQMAIKGIGITGGFGCGVTDFAAALESGTSMVTELTVPSAHGPLQLPAFRAETERLEEFVPKRTLRRIDHYSKMGLLGAHLALADGGLLGSDLSRLGVVVASGYGATATTFAFLDSIIGDGDICASPTHFANSVHNAAAANISIMLGAKGPSLTVSQFDMSVPSALVSARQWLAEGRVDAVLFGAIDELSDLIGYLQHRQRGSQHTGSISPLDAGAESSIIGEGAAFLLLTRKDESHCYCTIDTVDTGNLYQGKLAFPDNALLLLGADGRRELAVRYHAAVPAHSRVACYAPIYGSMPAAAAFDLAAAALILKNGRAYHIPGAAGCDMAGVAVPLETERICALRLAGANEFGSVVLSRI